MNTADNREKPGLPVVIDGVEPVKKSGYILIDMSTYRTTVDAICKKVLAGEMTMEEARKQSREATKLITSSHISQATEV